MPSWDKKTESWIGRAKVKGYPESSRRGFKNQTKAKEWEIQEKARIRSVENLDLSFYQASDQWIKACNKRYKHTTCEYKAMIVNNIMQFWGTDKMLRDINTIEIENYLDTLPGKTANRHKRELNTLFNFCLKRRLIEDNPVEVIEKYKETQYRRYVPPQEDIEAIMKVAPPLQKNILTVAYHTLARAGEIRALRWEDVDFEKGTITLWTGKRKGGDKEDDTLDMTDTLQNLLQLLYQESESTYVFTKDREPIKKWWLNEMTPKLCKKAKVTRFSLHGIRHHVAALLTYRLSLAQISKILRHRNMTTTDIYLRSIVKIETKGIKVLDDLSKSQTDNVIPFSKSAVK